MHTCPICAGFLDSHQCLRPWDCGILSCVKCGREVEEATGKVIGERKDRATPKRVTTSGGLGTSGESV